MGVLYIVSAEKASGKTAICAGLARNLLDAGRKVGYLKPKPGDQHEFDGDIAFMRQLLGLTDLVNAPDVVSGRDTVLVEAMLGPTAADPVSQATYGAAREMKARAVAVEACSDSPGKYLGAYQGFGQGLAGVIINKVPAGRLAEVREGAEARLNAAGVKLLGVLPEDRTLLAVTVAELAESLEGRILNNPDKSDELVERFMLGAMVVDSGLDYFKRLDNKAAVIRQDRPDMQLAALETPTKCLVLSGSAEPPPYNVVQKAEGHGIPVISTSASTGDIVEKIEEMLLGTPLNQEKKVKRLAELVKQALDIKALMEII